LTLCPALAGATNFEACVNDAKQNNSVVMADGYTAYKCDATTAEKLTARPDECPDGAKPLLRNLARKYRQLDDGLYTSLSWKAGRCLGSCETRSYDSKDTTYFCEVRIYADDGKPVETGPDAAPGISRRKAPTDFGRRPWRPAWYPPEPDRPAPERRWTWHSSPRTYRPDYYGRPDYDARPEYARRPSYYGRPPYSGEDYSDRSGYLSRTYSGRDYSGKDYLSREYSRRSDYFDRPDYYPGRYHYDPRPDETRPDCDCR